MKPLGKPVVFLGPTLHRSAAESLCDADFRPPAAMGDITRAAGERPEAIILIDGVFESRPAVWHKEILWAVHLGTPVIGASSMGALRAAELQDYGMAGYGSVFAAFAAGDLEDDDEVAVLHGPEELGWLPLTDAMVDIRHWVDLAFTQGVVSSEEQAAIVAAAKAAHFKLRTLEDAVRCGLGVLQAQSRLSRVASRLKDSGPGLKERDCQGLLSNLASEIAAARLKVSAAPEFVPTAYLRRLVEFGFPAGLASNKGARQ